MSKVSCEAAGKPGRAALRMARAELLTAIAKGKPVRAILRMLVLNREAKQQESPRGRLCEWRV